jgi:Hemerythrin HHE cation binding domain
MVTRKTSAKKAGPKRSVAKAPLKKAVVKKVPTAAKKPYKDNTADNTVPPKAKPNDAVDLLAADHLAAGRVFRQFLKLAKKDAAGEERKTLADKVCAMLTVHMTIEEQVFYPAARAAGIEPDEMDEAFVEHASAKELIAQILAGNPGDEYYDAKVKVLSDLIEHHVIEEHTEMFPRCRRSKMDLPGLRVQLVARKSELESEPAPKPGLLKRLTGG